MKLGAFLLLFSLFTSLSSALVARPRAASNVTTARSQVWVQTFATTTGQQLNLLDLYNQYTRVTHIYLASIHLNDPPGNIHLNDAPPYDPRYDYLWPQVRILQQTGVKVLMLLGGAAQGTFQRLSGSDEQFEAYYLPMIQMLRDYQIDGLDIDIEEDVDISVALRLLRRLDADMGPNFILTMAPVAAAMLPKPYAVSLSGFDYRDLDDLAVSSTRPSGKLVDWYNCQFYNGWGDASNLRFYNAIAIQGRWEPSRIVLGVLDHPGNGGSGFVPLTNLTEVIHQLRSMYPTFGGVIGWEYFNAGGGDRFSQPWQWTQAISNALYDPYTPLRVDTASSFRPTQSDSPWPEALSSLMGDGVGYFEALKALNTTNGDVGEAKAMVFSSF